LFNFTRAIASTYPDPKDSLSFKGLACIVNEQAAVHVGLAKCSLTGQTASRF
jgi:hypothetical protein